VNVVNSFFAIPKRKLNTLKLDPGIAYITGLFELQSACGIVPPNDSFAANTRVPKSKMPLFAE
jgi:hypothetical protein